MHKGVLFNLVKHRQGGSQGHRSFLMKFLLVNAVDRTKKTESLFEPLGLGYIASYLKDRFANIDIKIIDGDVERHLKQYSPDLVGLTTVTQNYGLAKDYAALAKSCGIPV